MSSVCVNPVCVNPVCGSAMCVSRHANVNWRVCVMETTKAAWSNGCVVTLAENDEVSGSNPPDVDFRLV